MKSDEIKILIKYRLEQAQTALDDAKYMIDGNRVLSQLILPIKSQDRFPVKRVGLPAV